MASGPIQGVGASKAKHKWGTGGNKSQNRSKQMMAARQERRIPPISPSNSIASEDGHHMVKISLNSISKMQVRDLKRKLKAELDDVRSLIKRLEAQGSIGGGFGFDMPRADAMGTSKKLKSGNGGKKSGVEADKGMIQIFKNCNNLLAKLMKQKCGWIFNTPVDVKGLGLHDYYTIIKKPMDLGTIKTRLSKNWYKSPLEFAEDVRLTFNNAMLYNPKGHDVHHMADHLLKLFEDKWVPIEVQYNNLNRKRKPTRDIVFPPPASTNAPYAEPLPAQTPSPSPPPPVVENRTLEKAESVTMPVEPEKTTMNPEQPKEKPPALRDLTFEEKRRLSEDLQDLPFDKLEVVVQIIKKRNPELSQKDDEIELDIDIVDLETLWELHRFVTDYKDSLGKKKEDHGFASEGDAESGHNITQEPSTLVAGAGTSKVTESGGITHMASAPVRQENPNPTHNGSGSSSSNSSSSDSGSCSSDSDSDSSSGRGSDAGN